MATYNPRANRPNADSGDDGEPGAAESQIDELLGQPAEAEPAPPVAETHTESETSTEEPNITVTVAQSPVETAGPPGPNVARIVALAAAGSAAIGGIFAWRKHRANGNSQS